MEELKNVNDSIGVWYKMSSEELASVTADKAKKEAEKYSGFDLSMRSIVKSAKCGKTAIVIEGITESDSLRLKELGYQVEEQWTKACIGEYCHVSKTFMVKW